jgi:hypothetical protein
MLRAGSMRARRTVLAISRLRCALFTPLAPVDRVDPTAEAMAQPVDPKSVIDVIKETGMATPR